MGKDAEADKLDDVVGCIKGYKEGTKKSRLFRKHFKKSMTYDNFERVVNGAINSGMVTQVVEGGVTLLQYNKEVENEY